MDRKSSHFFFACFFILAMVSGLAANDLIEREMKVDMRLIGHEVLLSVGDDTSRVLPIEGSEGRYKIRFSSPFSFEPTNLVQTIAGVVEKTTLASEYLVEVASCDSNQVVYSYKMGSTTTDLIPCRGRSLPEACYAIYMTILQRTSMSSSAPPRSNGNEGRTSFSMQGLTGFLILVLMLGCGFLLYRYKKKSYSSFDPDVIHIGDYRFNKRNMILSHGDQSIELTSKEADLLLLLYRSSNKTLERENILNVVWGDEGDYTGRTLDVFISKLRKKLNADNSLKIINIRGVGYRFVVNQ